MFHPNAIYRSDIFSLFFFLWSIPVCFCSKWCISKTNYVYLINVYNTHIYIHNIHVCLWYKKKTSYVINEKQLGEVNMCFRMLRKICCVTNNRYKGTIGMQKDTSNHATSKLEILIECHRLLKDLPYIFQCIDNNRHIVLYLQQFEIIYHHQQESIFSFLFRYI